MDRTTISRTFVEAPIQRLRVFRGAMGLMDCPGFDWFSPVSPSCRGHRSGPENYNRAFATTLTHEIQETHSSLDGFRGVKLGRFAGSEKNEPDWRLFCGHGRAPTLERLPDLWDAKPDG